VKDPLIDEAVKAARSRENPPTSDGLRSGASRGPYPGETNYGRLAERLLGGDVGGELVVDQDSEEWLRYSRRGRDG
jgi:hypothetical protein